MLGTLPSSLTTEAQGGLALFSDDKAKVVSAGATHIGELFEQHVAPEASRLDASRSTRLESAWRRFGSADVDQQPTAGENPLG